MTELAFGDAMWSKSIFETLDPVADLAALRSLSFTAKKITDSRVEPLGSLHGLTRLDIPTNLFTTEQLAWLRARLGDRVESQALRPLVHLERPLELGGRTRDVLLVGKRKPFLNSGSDSARVTRHVAHFDDLVTRFRAHPDLEPM